MAKDKINAKFSKTKNFGHVINKLTQTPILPIANMIIACVKNNLKNVIAHDSLAVYAAACAASGILIGWRKKSCGKCKSYSST